MPDPTSTAAAITPDASLKNASVRRLLPIEEVMDLCGVKRTELYHRIKIKDFPAPVKIGASSRWVSAEVDAWIGRVVAARDAQASRAVEGAAA